MSRIAKKFKKYERHILLGIVIILLGSFSVTGAMKCARSAPTSDFSGSFLVTPTERETISSAEFTAWADRFWRRGRYALRFPSVAFRSESIGPGRPVLWEYIRDPYWPPEGIATWAQILSVETARRAGYGCGEGQVGSAIRDLVRQGMGLEYSAETYQRYLREFYRGPSSDFQEVVREVVLADEFREPFVGSARYATTYDQAYDAWKPRRERVDLQYVAVQGAPFADRVKVEEETRESIAKQEELLQSVGDAARTVRALLGAAADFASKHDGKPPKDLQELVAAAGATLGKTNDPWKFPFAYEVRDGAAFPYSIGPDGKPGTADDVTPDVLHALETYAGLREVATALETWHGAAGSWPPDLAALSTKPSESALPPLKREVKDGWGHDFRYDAPTGDALPRLRSFGRDGTDATTDDIAADLKTKDSLVPAGPALSAYLLPDLRDAWGHPLRVQMKVTQGWVWEVSSPGPDGVPDTPDDVVGGNGEQLREFYSRPEVKADFVDPIRRKFVALAVHLPLVPDDVLKKLWDADAFKAQHPTESSAFEYWRMNRDEYYKETDPADPEKGHGAELAKTLAPGAKAYLVPDRSIFGDPPADLGGSLPKDDPNRKIYLDKGWREIALRERFFENLFAEFLKQARESRDHLAAWQERVDKKQGDPGPKPAEVTLKSIYEETLKPYLGPAGGDSFLRFLDYSDKALTRQEWEKNPDIGDVNFTAMMTAVLKDGEYPVVPISVNHRLSRVLAQNVEYTGERPLAYDEVLKNPDFRERYLAERSLERAKKELETLKTRIEEAEAKMTDAAGRAKAFDEALKAWSESTGATYVLETTGMFIGSSPPRSAPIPKDTSPEDAARIRRREYVWQSGYGTVAKYATAGDAVAPTEGTFGRTVLVDSRRGEDATKSAYLIRVRAQKDPTKEELSPFRFAVQSAQDYFGSLMSGRRGPSRELHAQTGRFAQTLGRFVDDFPWLESHFDLRTNIDLKKSDTAP